jgi:uncharacterized protein YerC
VPREVEPELSQNERIRSLVTALNAARGDNGLFLRFLRDLLSARELQDFANRWAAARQPSVRCVWLASRERRPRSS